MTNKHNNTFARKPLPYYIKLASGLSLLALSAAPSWAQTETKEETDLDALLEEVVVTGQRYAIMSAQDIKRDASQIVDSIVAEDIGKLPDRSITEALARVPGITVTRYDDMGDPEHFAGEGSGVAVRGLSFVRSELNGRDIFSASGGRALGFDDVPAELMYGVDTFKSPTADMIEGGLGGVVNLRTRMPFDSDEQLLSVTVKANYGDQIDDVNGEYSGLFSDRWDTAIGEVGLLIDISSSDLSSRADNVYSRAYFPRTDIVEGETRWIPRGTDWRRNDYQRERDGQYLALQWAPNDEVETFFTAFRSEHKQRWDEAAFFSDALNTNSIVPATDDWMFDSKGALVSGTLTGVITGGDSNTWMGMPFGTSTRLSANTSETMDFSLGVNWQATDRLQVRADLQRVESDATTEDYTLGLVAFPGAIRVSGLEGTPSLEVTNPTFDPGVVGTYNQHATDLADPASYSYGQMMSLPRDNEADSTAARLDLEYDFENSIVTSVQAGARYSEKNATNRSGGSWSARYQPWTAWLYPFPSAAESDLVEFSFDDFQRGDTNVPTTAYLLNPDLLQDFIGTTDRIVANTGGCCAPNLDDLDLNNPKNINKQKETTQAIYTKINFAFDNLAFPVDGNVGLRYIKTENSASGHFNINQSTVDVGAPPAEGQEDTRTTIVLLAEDSFDFPAENDYSHLLPSLNLRMSITDDLLFRVAASKALWRPEFSRLKAYMTLSAGLKDGVVLDGLDPNTVTLESIQDSIQYTLDTGGTNPYLKPMEANQYDLSLEWYFDKNGGMAHMSLFRKDISEYFFEGDTTAQVQGFDVKSTWIDNKGSARIQGVEIGLTKFFDFLPEPFDGFGIQANYTYIDSDLTGPEGRNTDDSLFSDLPAEGISKNSYNLVGIYEKNDFYARLAWNWRSEYLVAVGANGFSGSTNGVDWRLPVYNDDYGQLDLSLGYNIRDNISISLQANNITEEETVGLQDQGVLGKRHAYTYSQDVRYSASLRMTF